MFVAMFMVCLCVGSLYAWAFLPHVADWLTDAVATRDVLATPVSTVNDELAQAFGEREGSGDPDEEVTTVYAYVVADELV